MPYPMTHLLIAKNISDKNEMIIDKGSFLVGSLAPDSVHMRKEFDSDAKRRTHLCVGNEKWGETTENEGWQESALSFLDNNIDSPNLDFYRGYCTHVLTDMLWNKEFWNPFRFYCIKNYGSFRESDEKSWRQECVLLDNFLYKEVEDEKEMWKAFNSGSLEDIPNIIYKEDVLALKDHMLNRQYKSTEFNDCLQNKLIPLDKKRTFISESANYIENLIR